MHFIEKKVNINCVSSDQATIVLHSGCVTFVLTTYVWRVLCMAHDSQIVRPAMNGRRFFLTARLLRANEAIVQRNSYVSFRRCCVAVIPDTPYVCKLTCKCVSVHVALPIAKLHVPVYRLPAISQFLHYIFSAEK